MRKSYRSEFFTISRRDFLLLSAASAVSAATGCATNPVSGRRQLMLLSESKELELDQTWAPHQFSADYGAVQDDQLNAYISLVGDGIAAETHRPSMPYNFRALNATCVNAYTFPAGSIGVARGLLLEMNNESQLAAVLGHELGHVNARHAARQMTKNLLITFGVLALTSYIEHENKKYAGLAAGLGMIGGNMLLCRYSRANERESDSLGMEYMTRANHNPKGMAEIMEIFIKLQKEKPGVVDLLFSTHPMSDERYSNAQDELRTKYTDTSSRSTNVQRYMDHTAGIRAQSAAIKEMQNGSDAMMEEKLDKAESHFAAALKHAPSDYTALLMMAKCCLARKQISTALRYAQEAKSVYSSEPQAMHVMGMAKTESLMYDSALDDFTSYETALPGNPNTIFYKGLCHEKMNHVSQSASEYQRYLNEAPDGEFAEHVQKRLIEWGYMAPPQTEKKQSK